MLRDGEREINFPEAVNATFFPKVSLPYLTIMPRLIAEHLRLNWVIRVLRRTSGGARQHPH